MKENGYSISPQRRPRRQWRERRRQRHARAQQQQKGCGGKPGAGGFNRCRAENHRWNRERQHQQGQQHAASAGLSAAPFLLLLGAGVSLAAPLAPLAAGAALGGD